MSLQADKHGHGGADAGTHFCCRVPAVSEPVSGREELGQQS